MEALTRSSFKSFAEYNTASKAFLFSKTVSSKPLMCFFPIRKNVTVDSLRSFPLHIKAIESPGFFSTEEHVVSCLETEDAVLAEHDTSGNKTVCVKFQLQKECVFGQRFLIVGDDPMFGMWDPSCAIPLKWSDGHIWTVELDLLVGKTLQFKFLLEGENGEVVWQPGPNRIVQIWESENTVVVSEDWESAEVQESIEEPPLMKPSVEGDISCPEEELMANANSESIDSEPNGYLADLVKLFKTSANSTDSQEENISSATREEFDIARSTADINGGVISKNDASEEIYEGGHVLVPGLEPLPTMPIQDSASQLVEEE